MHSGVHRSTGKITLIPVGYFDIAHAKTRVLNVINNAMARKNAMAVALGSRGGKATAKKMTPEERSEKMRRVARARWAKTKKKNQ
jgi:hypothetical protein